MRKKEKEQVKRDEGTGSEKGPILHFREEGERVGRERQEKLDPPSMKCDSFMRNLRVREEEKVGERERERY